MTIKNLYPVLKPSLNLDFANSKRLDPRITFTRASTGTYVGEDGLIKTAATNEARFDHDGDGNSLGLLIEESRTNIYLQSQNFSTWTGDGVTATSNSGSAPDGTTTANLLQETTATQSHYIYRPDAAVTSGTIYTFSVFLKKGSGATAPDWVNLRFSGNGFIGGSASFNLATGVVGNTAGLLSYGISAFPGGWYRCYITETADETRNSGGLVLFTNNQNVTSLPSYTGQTTSDVYAWGAQFEAGSFPTSYIPTTSSTVTRSSDVASMTGTNFSSWYNQSEGTLFQDCISRTPLSGSITQDIGVGIFVRNNSLLQMGFLRYLTNLNVVVYTGSEYSANFNFVSQWPQNVTNKAALAYKVNDFAASTNGSAVQTDTSGEIPAATQLDIGQMSSAAYNRIGAGTFARITYYPVRLPDATLQALTT